MAKFKGKTIEEVLNNIPDLGRQQAESYLNNDRVLSVKCCDDGFGTYEFEAFIAETEEVILLPILEVDEALKIQDILCQCNAGFCIHKIALLIAARFMIENNCSDYHLAKKALLLRSLENNMLH